MSETRPAAVATLRAAITLDGKLADPAPEFSEGEFSREVDASEAGALLAAGRVREIHLTVHPRVDGRRDALTLSGPPTPEFFPASLVCRLLGMETRGGECLLHYRVLRRARPARK